MGICTTNIKADFLGLDFLAEDFNILDTSESFAIKFENFLFSLLPHYFKAEDSYKDIDDKGLLERYLSIFGAHIDSKIIPDITCYLNIIDAAITPSKYLNHISDSLGNPPDIFKEEAEYRNLLSYIVSVYKIKGTRESYELFFNILGFDYVITEIIPTVVDIIDDLGTRYDSEVEFIYDADIPELTYDLGGCEPCSEYDVTLTAKPGTNIIVDDSLRNRINETISFNQPINAVLRTLTING